MKVGFNEGFLSPLSAILPLNSRWSLYLAEKIMVYHHHWYNSLTKYIILNWIVYTSKREGINLTTYALIDTDYIGRCKSNCCMITATMAT
jgi:hypothetical protein